MKIYNTLSREIQDFKPLDGRTVKIYTCGLTVYSHPHIGNWVGYIYWDVLVRALKASGYKVERTQNITDVGHLTSDEDSGEDKLEKGAKKEGITAWEVADKYIEVAAKESEQLGLLPADHLVRATDYIDQQINFVKKLEEKGFTYTILNDGVYFDTSKLNDYGKLARLDIKGLKPGARVPVDGKMNTTDFALWKFSHKGVKRDMEWESPWGLGFPGWHLECSVIARETLGDQIDIHTGGIDHIPVHHTNEIAQTESITGKQFSQFWIHNNHLKVNGTKIAKSLGNGCTLQDIVNKGYSINAFKLMVLSKHYRTEGNFTWDILEASNNRLKEWQAIADMRWQVSSVNAQVNEVDMAKDAILAPLSDDLNTPLAIKNVEDSLKHFYVNYPNWGKNDMDKLLSFIKELLGIDLAKPDITSAQKSLINDREAVRGTKDWNKSDELRDVLKRSGVDLKDTDHGPIWSRL